MPERYSIAAAESMGWPVLLADTSSNGIAGVALNRPVCVVGGRCLVHLPLDSQTVSKSHALIVQDTGGIHLRDLSSKNKTYVNGQAVREVWLNPADEVRIGEFSFRCYSGFARMTDLPPAPAAELWLEGDGLASRQVASVKQWSFVIGSRRGNDLVLSGDDVALAHAVIFTRNDRRYLRDLSTMTGTTVNGKRIREIELQAGDEIRIAATRIEYHPIAPQSIKADDSSDTAAIGLAEDDDKPQPFLEPVATGEIQFAKSEDNAAATSAKREPGDEIILPWDEPGPIELELTDSHTGRG